jgi:hypothetical protein
MKPLPGPDHEAAAKAKRIAGAARDRRAAMTPATLMKLEWAGEHDGIACCALCKAFPPDRPHPDQWHRERYGVGHRPDCELDAAIREAEQAEKGERPEIRNADAAEFWREGQALYRDPLWRQEPPTHD